jgi:serine phosphatase RsbU (regulator of sigma subunit)/tetratricopeptide (TPR) repeat protein
MIALFQGRPFLMVQFIVRDYHNVHFLGPTAETAIASSVYGAAMGLLGLRRVMERYTQLGVAMAEQLGDRSAHAVAKVYQAAGTKWAGDLIQGNDLMLAVLPEVQRHAPGSWYASMAMAEQAYSFLHMGRSTEAIELVRTNLSQIERTNNLMFRYNDVSVQYAETMVQGDTSEATHLWARLEEQYPPISKTIYVRLARCIAVLEVMVDQEETGAALDEAVEAFHDLVSEDYYSNMARVLIGYARVIQYEQADDEGRPAARARLRAATRSLGLRAMVPVFACHPPIWRATLHRHEGRFTSAARCLEKADRLASRCGSRRGAFYVALERARLARDSGDSAARFFAMQALELARSERWKLKAQRVVSEFKLSTDRAQTLSRATVHSTVGGGLSPEQARRYADALLQVSLASASSLEPEVMARNALHELARVLGAERALFFLLDPETAELKLMAQAGAGAETISRTVVRKVLETKAPLVLTGTDKDEDIDKGSILAHGLRSILAAPLLLRDRLLGVVYLDSRLARSMFTEADVDLLLGVSNHIAIAVETARNARVEAERSAMQRDLALLGAVQTLLLPKSPVFTMKGLQGAGFYQPATQSGGDWWWYEALQDGRCLLLVGDVSGHGAASAMITGAVAGAFRALFDQVGEMAPPALIAALDHQVRAFGGEFHMTLSVLVLDAERRQIRWWNAAAPPIFVLYGGKARSFSNRGNMLGGDLDLVVHEQILPFAEGDRLLVCTDGLLEMKVASGREFGARRTLSLLNSTSGVPIEALPGRLGREINSLLGGREQDDDITFVVLEATPVSPSPQPPSADARHVMQSLEKPHFSSS